MKKLFIIALTAVGLLACTGQNGPSNPVAKNGTLPGKFSVSETTQIQFAQGNLQYQASTKTWQFAEHQYDAIGEANKNISDTYDGWIDLFGYGTGNNPTLSSKEEKDYEPYVEWGVNAISNGGNKANMWRTLTRSESEYLFASRANAATLFGFGSVNKVNGLIILPDNWVTPKDVTFTPSTELGLADMGGYGLYRNEKEDNFSHNTYTAEQWSVMEKAGAVFLPAAGIRLGTGVGTIGVWGYYWVQLSYDLGDDPWITNITLSNYELDAYRSQGNYYGVSVRLVR